MPHPQLLAIWVVAAIGFLFVVWISWRLASAWEKLSPRRRWAYFAAAAVVELFYWLCVYGFLIQPQSLVVRRVEVASPEWRGPPLTIAVIADTEIGGPYVDAARVGRIVSRVNALGPDLVAFLGDSAAGGAPEAERSPASQQEVLGGLATFAAFSARYGVVAVLGDGDLGYGRRSITTALQNAGVAVLWNRNVVIPRAERPIVVVGIAPERQSASDFDVAIEGAPADADVLVLSHFPGAFAALPRGPALMLAADPHCGSLGGGDICGLVRQGGRTIYVSGGISLGFSPLRFLAAPEVALLRISNADERFTSARG